jgi:hypothetical protein
MSETYYRIRDFRYAAPLDEFERPMGSGSPGFTLETYRVLRRTPKGVWLQRTWGAFNSSDPPRFVLDGAHKRFALPTLDEALASWRARKAAQKRIYTNRLRAVEDALQAVDREVARWRVLEQTDKEVML